jgi:cytochrome P450
MFENATALVLAGSRTTSDTLGALTYLLITHPDCLRRATDEVRSNFKSTDELTLESVSSLPYLQAAISETFRRRPAGPFGLPRIIPEGGATIDGKSVPQNVCLSS